MRIGLQGFCQWCGSALIVYDPDPGQENQIDFKTSFKCQEKKIFSNLYLELRDYILF